MDKKQIEALQSIIEKQDEAIRILSYRTDMILNMLSALTAALGGTKTNVYREVVIQQIDKFEKPYQVLMLILQNKRKTMLLWQFLQ
ncbi:hypothetical protein ECDEC2C_1411 [Escherichia coli DEC2C]|uniref:hypothetical protein n=1 Tax=Escherichia coli TaxID=562 RepID=UPI000250FF1E|nr:hypothetical protein [Escherichia coli]EHU13703.1 hypothetical protein ECDEC1C_1408 [Escherichia coli DEC1C]EHU47262.1 hypothetical protein ECDEC2C_1411 [Escherichia coli DEC2C]